MYYSCRKMNVSWKMTILAVSHALRDSDAVYGVLYDGLVDAIILVPMFAVYVKTLGSDANMSLVQKFSRSRL